MTRMSMIDDEATRRGCSCSWLLLLLRRTVLTLEKVHSVRVAIIEGSSDWIDKSRDEARKFVANWNGTDNSLVGERIIDGNQMVRLIVACEMREFCCCCFF